MQTLSWHLLSERRRFPGQFSQSRQRTSDEVLATKKEGVHTGSRLPTIQWASECSCEQVPSFFVSAYLQPCEEGSPPPTSQPAEQC